MSVVKPMFAGKKFFVLMRVPMRASFIETIEKYGGLNVRVEAQADYKIADHARKDAPDGSISYRFIEEAVRIGEIPDVEKHTIGQPGNVTRTTGTTSTAGNKPTRTPFTAADDRILWEWVTSSTEAEKGNVLYDQLALKVREVTSVDGVVLTKL